jgi:hypothetical protein
MTKDCLRFRVGRKERSLCPTNVKNELREDDLSTPEWPAEVLQWL